MGKLVAIGSLIKPARLGIRLMLDRRVPVYMKALPLLAVVYMLSPLDIIPDWVPVLGQMDDLAVLGVALTAFVRICPPAIVEEHEIALKFRKA